MKKLTASLCLTLLVFLGSAGKSFAEGEWVAIENIPNCVVWNVHPQENESISWSGTCENGKVHGKGIERWRFQIEGEWKEEVFEGEQRNGKANGQGTLTTARGGKYVGEFKDGKANGQGTFTFKRNKYVGEWEN